MSKNLTSLRERYQEARNLIYNNDVKKVDAAYIGRVVQDTRKELESMQRSNNFTNIDEVDFYQDRFLRLETALTNANKFSMPIKDYANQAKDIFKDPSFANRQSLLNQPAVEPKPKPIPMEKKLSNQPVMQSKVLQSFFEQKKSKIAPKTGFASLLENPVGDKEFKSKIGANNDQISRLKYENEELRRKLQAGKSSQQIEDSIRNQEERIRFLKAENQRIEKENSRLLSQQSVSVKPSVILLPKPDKFSNNPYIIEPRQNNLGKISARNSSESGQDEYNTYSKYNGPVEYSYNDYNQQPAIGYGIRDSATVTRNKLAFFRESGIIVREDEFDISYTRFISETDFNQIGLFFHNKSSLPMQVSISYEFQQNYYTIKRLQQISPTVYAHSQSQQTLQIHLTNKDNLNSIILCTVTINNSIQLQLWVPAMFLTWQLPPLQQISQQYVKRKVYPSPLFASESQAIETVGGVRGQDRRLLLWARRGSQEGAVGLKWSNSRVEIETSEKWMDFISFLIFDFR